MVGGGDAVFPLEEIVDQQREIYVGNSRNAHPHLHLITVFFKPDEFHHFGGFVVRLWNGCPIEAESEFLGDIIESDVYFGIQVHIASHSAKIIGSAAIDPLAKFGSGNLEKLGFCIVGMIVAQFGVIYLFIIEDNTVH